MGAWILATSLGLISGAMATVASVSMAALIFAGDLSAYLGSGIEIALVTAVVAGLAVALFSSGRVAIAIPQDRTAPILAIMASAIAAAAPASATGDAVFLTIVAAIVATTLLTGATLLALGLTRAGNLIRFVPYSVLGGFFAGTGWLLVLGGMRVMTSLPLGSLAEVAPLFGADLLLRWLPGLLIALAILGVSRFASSGTALPVILLASAGMFYLVMFNNGASLDALLRDGWLLGGSQHGAVGIAATSLPALLAHADWSLVPDQWANMATVVAITGISMILTVSALEMLSGENLDIHHEMRVTGLANLASGLSGGMVGFHSLSISGLALKLGARSRITSIVAALTAAAMIYGVEVLSLLPRVVVGGLLLFIGISFLAKWLIRSWGKLPPGEFLVIPLILLTIAAVGFIEGLVVGLLAAFIQFVLTYSRTPVVRYALSGGSARSMVERNLDDEHCLSQQGEQLFVLKLRGYLFFGTAAQITARITTRATDPTKAPLRYVLLDFEAVNGVDSSALYEFHRLRKLAEQRDFIVVLTGLTPDLEAQLAARELFVDDGRLRSFSNWDLGLEWCENQILRSGGHCHPKDVRTALQHLAQRIPNGSGFDDLLAYLSEVAFDAGDTLIRQGDEPGDVFFLEAGDVSVYLRPAIGDTLRIRRTGPGTVLGELGFYLGTPRSASVVADSPGRAYRLTADALARMEQQHPALAAALHRFMADLLAERLLRTTHTLESVLN